MKHTLKKVEKEQLSDKITSYLFQRHEEIIAAYIFGSLITADRFSDIDIGVIMYFAPDR